MRRLTRVPEPLELEAVPEPVEIPSNFYRCASKVLESEVQLVTPSPEGRKWDKVDFVATLNCPKTMITGTRLFQSVRTERLQDQNVKHTAEDLGKIATFTVCEGCKFADMGVNEAYTEALAAFETRQRLSNAIDLAKQFNQPPQGLHNPDDLR